MNRSPRRFEAITGAVAGLGAGVVVAAAMEARGVAHPGLLPITSGYGWLPIHLAVSMLLGAGFGVAFRFRREAYAATVSVGMGGGLMWWVVGPLSIRPLLMGVSPRWSIAEAIDLFPNLIGAMFYGSLLGLLFYVVAATWLRWRPVEESTPVSPQPRTRVLILGGGFGGVGTARRLEQIFVRDPSVEITLVSQGNYLLFTPMLAEVASSSLEAQHISAPVRASCPRTRFVNGEVESVDPAGSATVLCGGERLTLPFDHVVVALGSVPHFYGLPGLQEHAFTLKSLSDATRLRNHVIRLLEQAEFEQDPAERKRKLTFVVAGGGFAGTETVAELFDFVHGVLHFYPALEPGHLRFVLVHSRERILPEIGDRLAAFALRKLRDRGIEFVLGERITGATAYSVQTGAGEIPTATLVWTAGNRPNPVLERLPGERNRAGALVATSTLQLKGHTNLWGAGDCIEIPVPDTEGATYPPTAQHALREGRAVADNIAALLKGKPAKPFRYKALGILVALGHRTAVAEIRGLRFSGLVAWLMWRGVYFWKLPGAERKARVMFDWALDLFFPRDTVVTGDGPAPIASRGTTGKESHS